MADALILEFKSKTDDLDKRLNDIISVLDRIDAKSKAASASVTTSFEKSTTAVTSATAKTDQLDKSIGKVGQTSHSTATSMNADMSKVGKTVQTEVTGKVVEADKKVSQIADTSKNSSGIMSSAFTKLGGVIAATFAVQNIIAFGKEAVNLAAKAEGVERAFARVGNEQILDGLRKATRGTVSDLVLMQNAVRASNFQIPLEQLASLFKFAQARARETGESVDYLVDSIILGIGRKSPMILDNLGISAIELKSKLNGVSTEAASIGDVAAAVGSIAQDNLAKMGEQADTAADKMAQLTTSTENLKVALGKLIADEAVAVTSFFANLSKAMTELITEEDRLKTELSGQSGLKILARLREEQAKLAQMEADATENVGRVREAESQKMLAQIERQKGIIAAIEQVIQSKRDEGIEYEITTDKIDDAIRAYKELQAAQTGPVRSIELLNGQLKDLRGQLEKAEIGSQGFWNILFKIQTKIKELSDAQAMTKLIDDLNPDADDTTAQDEKTSRQIQREIDKNNKLKKEREDYQKWLDDQISKEISAELEKINEIEAAEKAARERKKQADLLAQEESKKIALAAMNATIQLIGIVSQAQQQATQNELAQLQNALDAGQITREEYDLKRRRLLREQAKQDKELALIQAIIATAAAVAEALPNVPLSIIAGVLGAAQVAAIAAQPLPQFAKGVIGLQGEGTETSDSIHARLSRGESVMTAKETRQHRPILEAIRKGTLEKLIAETYVRPAVDSAMLSGFADMGRSADLNGLTAKLSDHNIIAAMDRNRSATVYGLKMLADKLDKRTPKRGGYA